VQPGTQSFALQVDPCGQSALTTHVTHCRELGSHFSPGHSASVEHSTQIPVCGSQVRAPPLVEQSVLLAQPRSQLCVATLHLRPFWQLASEVHSTQLPLAGSQTSPPKGWQSVSAAQPEHRCLAMLHCGTIPPHWSLEAQVVCAVGIVAGTVPLPAPCVPAPPVLCVPAPPPRPAPPVLPAVPVAPVLVLAAAPAAPLLPPVPAAFVPPDPELAAIVSRLLLLLQASPKTARLATTIAPLQVVIMCCPFFPQCLADRPQTRGVVNGPQPGNPSFRFHSLVVPCGGSELRMRSFHRRFPRATKG
jgi:hypothetical protein